MAQPSRWTLLWRPGSTLGGLYSAVRFVWHSCGAREPNQPRTGPRQVRLDVKNAHRLIPITLADWALLCLLECARQGGVREYHRHCQCCQRGSLVEPSHNHRNWLGRPLALRIVRTEAVTMALVFRRLLKCSLRWKKVTSRQTLLTSFRSVKLHCASVLRALSGPVSGSPDSCETGVAQDQDFSTGPAGSAFVEKSSATGLSSHHLTPTRTTLPPPSSFLKYVRQKRCRHRHNAARLISGQRSVAGRRKC